ncbi:MAG: hypothetical protein LBB51_04245, partial [Zoogloeaceae bacterium]|nr:hypothetical protein [Zoogloeaceae bacterium]
MTIPEKNRARAVPETWHFTAFGAESGENRAAWGPFEKVEDDFSNRNTTAAAKTRQKTNMKKEAG